MNSRLYYLVFLLNSIIIIFVKSAPSIWMIRHCDKLSDNDPCCSDIGYERSKKWYYYFQEHISRNDKIKIMTSKYGSNKKCINEELFRSDIDCQKSQRMFLTSKYLLDEFIINGQNKYDDILEMKYCVDEVNRLYRHIDTHIKNGTSINHMILVLEHNDIVDLINKFNLNKSLTKWTKSYDNHYDIVFKINKNTLTYDCYDYHTNNTSCPNEINKWLINYDQISNTHKTNNQVSNESENNRKYIYMVMINILVVVVPIIFTLLLELLFRKMNHLRYEEIELINDNNI